MRIMTWNILHQDFAKKECVEWSRRLFLIRKKIIESVVDVVCLQEVDSFSILTDFDGLGYDIFYQNDKNRQKQLKKWIDSNFMLKKPNTIVCAILVKKGLKVNEVRITSRTITVCIEDHFRITNVHLETKNSGSDEMRRKHLEKIVDSDVVCGDFNSFIGDPSLAFLEEKKYVSCYDKLPLFTFTDCERKWVIDHMYIRGLKKLGVYWEEIENIPNEQHPSDHIPIVLEIQ